MPRGSCVQKLEVFVSFIERKKILNQWRDSHSNYNNKKVETNGFTKLTRKI